MIEITSNLGNVSILTETQSRVIAAAFMQQLLISASITDGNSPDLFTEDVVNSTNLIQENLDLPLIMDSDDPELPEEFYEWGHIYDVMSDVKMNSRDLHEFVVWSDQTKDLFKV